MSVPTLRKWVAIGFLVLLLNTAYVWAFAFPTIFYMTNVLMHLGLGVALSVVLFWLLGRDERLRSGVLAIASFFLLAFLIGVYLAAAGNIRSHRVALWAHIVAALVGVLALFT